MRCFHLWPLLLAVMATGGCSGINVTKSVSPLDFLLPGLHMKYEPPVPADLSGTNTLVCSHAAFSARMVP